MSNLAQTEKSFMVKNHFFRGLSAVFLGLSVYLFILNIQLKKSLKELDKVKEQELKQRLEEEQARIRQDLEEKYRADMVSYEALGKRLDIERQRTRELQEKLKKIENKTQKADSATHSGSDLEK